jgi:hypothetical protein
MEASEAKGQSSPHSGEEARLSDKGGGRLTDRKLPKSSLSLPPDYQAYMRLCEIVEQHQKKNPGKPVPGPQIAKAFGKAYSGYIFRLLDRVSKSSCGRKEENLIVVSGDGLGIITPRGRYLWECLRKTQELHARIEGSVAETTLKVASSETFGAHVMWRLAGEPLVPILFRPKRIVDQIHRSEVHLAVFWNWAYGEIPLDDDVACEEWHDFDTSIHVLFSSHDPLAAMLQQPEKQRAIRLDALEGRPIYYPALPKFRALVRKIAGATKYPVEHLAAVFGYVAASKGSAVALIPGHQWLMEEFGVEHDLDSAELDAEDNRIGVAVLRAKHLQVDLEGKVKQFLLDLRNGLKQLISPDNHWRCRDGELTLPDTLPKEWRVYFRTNRRRGKRVAPFWHVGRLSFQDVTGRNLRGDLVFDKSSCEIAGQIKAGPRCLELVGTIKTRDFQGHAVALLSSRLDQRGGQPSSLCLAGGLLFDAFDHTNTSPIILTALPLQLRNEADMHEIASVVPFLAGGRRRY